MSKSDRLGTFLSEIAYRTVMGIVITLGQGLCRAAVFSYGAVLDIALSLVLRSLPIIPCRIEPYGGPFVYRASKLGRTQSQKVPARYLAFYCLLFSWLPHRSMYITLAYQQLSSPVYIISGVW